MVGLYDRVALKSDLTEHNLKQGDIAALID